MAFLYDDDPVNELFFKYIVIPVFILIIIGSVYDSLKEEPIQTNYEWITPEDMQKAEQEKERKWARENGVEWKLDNIKKFKPMRAYGADNRVDDLENGNTKSSVFREYMEELDNRGIDPGSPRAVEIWDTYYK